MLEPYLKPVLSKHRGVALGIWGEAGIGKSHYTTQLLKNLSCATLSVHSKVNLSTLAAQLPKPKKLPLWAGKTLEKVQLGESVETSNLISALGASLAGLAPFVLHLEDVHEADAERLAFVTDLAQSIRKLKGVGLLVSSRQLPSEPFMAVKLESLTKETSDNLLEQELSATLPKEGLEFIYGKAAGNPLFTLEYVRFLTRQGNLWNDGKNWHWRKPEQDRMPVVVEALLEQMIEHAKQVPMQAYVLEAKALLPLESSNDLWQKVARVTEAELTTTLQDLATQGIFKDQGFAHPLFREVTLKTLSSERKQHLSRRAINALQDDPVQAVLFLDNAKLEKEKSLELLKKAADKTHRPQEKGWLLAKATDYAAADESLHLALDAAQILQHVDLEQAISLAKKTLTNLELRERAIELLAMLYARKSDTQAIDTLLATSKQNPDRLRMGIFLTLGQYPKIIAIWESNPEQKDAKVLFAAAAAHLATRKITEFHHILEQALSLPLTLLERANFLGLKATFYLNQGEYVEAIENLKSNIAVLRETSDTVKLGAQLNNLALSYQGSMDFLKAQQAFKESLEIRRSMKDLRPYATVLAALAILQADLGEQSQAEASVEESSQLIQLLNNPYFQTIVFSQASYVYSQNPSSLGELLELKYASQALELARQSHNKNLILEILYDFSVAQTRSGHYQQGFEAAQEMVILLAEVDNVQYQWRTKKALAMAQEALGHRELAKTLWLEAAGLARDVSDLPNEQKLGLELDRLNDDLESARERMQWFEERGLMNGVNIAKRYFPELAATDTPPIVLTLEELPRLEVLGVMQLRSGNQPESIKGSKRQEFLALLLEAKLSGRTDVGKLELFDLLYPDQDELKASSSLRDLVSTLRELMGASAIITTASGYALGNVPSDAEQFLKTGDTSLWRGVYLQGLSIEGQETVSEPLYLTLFEKAKGLLETNPKEVARLGKMLLEVDPYNRDYLTLCLQAFRESNNHKSLTRLYHESTERFVEVGERLPENWQAFLGS